MALVDALRLQRAGRSQEAERIVREHLTSHPSDPAALSLLGVIASQTGRPEEAIGLMSRAADLAPGEVHYRINLAALIGAAGRPEEAVSQLGRAMLVRADVPELHSNLGAALEKLGRIDEAIPSFETALRLKADFFDARRNLANALRKSGRFVRAAGAYREALRARPGDGDLLNGLSECLSEIGEVDELIACARHFVSLYPTAPAPRSSLLYVMHYHPSHGPEELSREHREWGRIFCDPWKDKIAPHENNRDPGRRLRVGYVSPDLREHTVTKFIGPAITHHDRERFEVYCYSEAERADHVTERVKSAAEGWRDTRKLHDNALGERIRQDGIDILVDLRGHGGGNRLTLFGRKPAPVQVNMVGYFNTTGLATMDYRVTDEHMDPSGVTEHINVERLVCIEPSCWCYAPEPDAPGVSDPPVAANGCVTFGSLNKIVKVSGPCARLWTRVLESVPGSRLVVSAAGDAATAVRERLSSFGLPASRLEIVGKTRTAREYLERFNEIDIALDTWPFNGITTTCDGLWMGVPCVSMTGGTSVSRAGKSILHAAGLAELSTESPEAFVAVASELARDLDRLSEMRRTMRERLLASPLMDHRGFARKLDAAYRQMWRAWCERTPDPAA